MAAEAQVYADMLSLVGLKREQLICPVFVSERQQEAGGAIAAMPGMFKLPSKDAVTAAQKIYNTGIHSIIVFGIPKSRNGNGSNAADKNGVVQRVTREIKSAFGRSLNVITDVCTCQYNLSGHCGLIVGSSTVENDRTLRILAEISQSHATAGADVVAPSAMMDGQVRAIRDALDKNGHCSTTRILSYSAKHSSSLYTPFRSAAFAKRKTVIDKSGYQVSYANPKQAMREIAGDIEEGADMVMVKPALAYLDIVRRAKKKFGFPLAVQNVSGEYAMIKAAGMRGWIDEEQWKVATLAAMRRAGADRIISYFALDVAQYLQ